MRLAICSASTTSESEEKSGIYHLWNISLGVYFLRPISDMASPKPPPSIRTSKNDDDVDDDDDDDIYLRPAGRQ
jgi:hypothetical protein